MEAIVDSPLNVNGSPKKQKRKKQRMLAELLVDYAKKSSLPCLTYMTDPRVIIIDRIFWAITFIISVVLSFIFIQQIYHKRWIETPVIISVKDQMVSVGAVSFPSVTICPQQKIVSSRYNYSSELEKSRNKTYDYGVKSAMKLEDIRLICKHGKSHVEDVRNCANSSTIRNILGVSPTRDDVFEYCTWRGRHHTACEDIFTRVLTNEGVCYNFNSVAADEMFKNDSIQGDYSYMDSSIKSKKWNPELNYLDADSNAYPWRGMTKETQPDLQIYLKYSTDDLDRLCDGMNKGYKIYLHHPTDIPQASLPYYAASANKLSSLAIKLNMITTATSLKEYSPDVRKCYFPGEHPLQYFQIYTQKNCQLECQSKFVFKKCGCVRFYMPHNDSESICTRKKYKCVEEALDELAESQLKAELNFEIPTCGCFPACNSFDYDAEMTSTDYDVQDFVEFFYNRFPSARATIFGSFPKTLVNSKIDFYFKEPRFVAMHRSELYSWIEILANFGGLLGLFLGFSFLSIVEIIYFATFRLYYILKKDS